MQRVRRLLLGLGLLAAVFCGGAYLLLVLPAPEVCPIQPAEQQQGSWKQAADMPTDRSEIAAATLDGKIYVAGGLRLTGASKAFEVYSSASDRWQTLASLPVSLHHFGMVALAGRLYVTGGYEGNSFSDSSSAVWAYDPALDAWAAVAPMPDGRAAHAAAVAGDRLYVIGGAGLGSTFVWVYDPETDTWDTLPGMLPTPREHLAAAALDGKLYAIGGRWPGQGNLSVVERYDLALGTWQRLPDLPTARGGLTAAAIAGHIHVTGGEDFDRRPTCTFAQHEVYDPATDQWLALPSLPTPRHGLASAALDGNWYVMGGGTKAAALTLVSSSDRVEIFTP